MGQQSNALPHDLRLGPAHPSLEARQVGLLLVVQQALEPMPAFRLIGFLGVLFGRHLTHRVPPLALWYGCFTHLLR